MWRSERHAERDPAVEVPGMIAAPSPVRVVGAGTVAHVAVEPIVAVGDVTGKRKILADVPGEFALDCGVHQSAVVKRLFGTLALDEVPGRTLRITKALPDGGAERQHRVIILAPAEWQGTFTLSMSIIREASFLYQLTTLSAHRLAINKICFCFKMTVASVWGDQWYHNHFSRYQL